LLLLFLLVAVAPWVSMVVRRRRRAAT
jgi:hypothetical protein